MLVLVLTLGLLSLAQAQEYHYPRPQIPFHLTPQPQPTVTKPPTRYIVQTQGPQGRTYELQSYSAPAIYVGHQTITVPGSYQQQQLPQQQQPYQQQQQPQQQQQQYEQLQPPQQQQYQQQQPQQQQQFQQQHVHQQHIQQQHFQQQQQLQQQLVQQQQQQPLQHHVQQPPQQLYASPLLVNTNYQQQAVALTAPPAPATTYYTPPQPQYQAPVQVQSNVQTSADNYYNPPQALTADTATHAQPFSEYGPPPLPELPEPPQSQPQPHNSNPLPYAIVTLPNGQRVPDAGHGSGAPPAASGHPPRVSDYSSQSQSASLDAFNYKQTVPGDARSFQRFVTKCQPNGQCQRLTLHPGQIDPDHQQLLQAARAQVLPPPSNCKKAAYIPPGAYMNPQGQLRPLDRRAKKHTEEQLSKYPYN